MSSQDFSAIIQNIREDFYKGIIQEAEAHEILQEVMRDFGMLNQDEYLVGLPGNFCSNTGYIGAFRVKHFRSPYTWSRNYGLSCISDLHIGPVVGGDVKINENTCTEIDPEFPPLSEKDKAFFAPYEQQMIE